MDDERLPHFALRLRQLREEAGLTQYALAQRAGVAKQAIHRLEAGTSNPAWTLLQRLALALGVDYSEFADPEITVPGEQGRRLGRPPRTERPPSAEAAPPAEGGASADAPPAKGRKKGQARKE